MAKRTPVGEMNRRIKFQSRQETDDGYGGKTVVWLDYASAWAKVEPLSGREYFDAHQTQADVTHKVTTRFRGDIDEMMRIAYGEKILEIEAVLDVESAHQRLVIMAREVK